MNTSLEAVPAEVSVAEGAVHVVAAAVLLDGAVAVRTRFHVDPRHEEVRQVRLGPIGLIPPPLRCKCVDVPGEVQYT